eukprot:5937935-Pyramimonas_sp.AAC.1
MVSPQRHVGWRFSSTRALVMVLLVSLVGLLDAETTGVPKVTGSTLDTANTAQGGTNNDSTQVSDARVRKRLSLRGQFRMRVHVPIYGSRGGINSHDRRVDDPDGSRVRVRTHPKIEAGTASSPLRGALTSPMTLSFVYYCGLTRRLSLESPDHAQDTRFSGPANALACGVMLAASFDLIHEGQPHGSLEVVVGVVLGALFIKTVQEFLHQYEDLNFESLSGADARKTLLVVSTVELRTLDSCSTVPLARHVRIRTSCPIVSFNASESYSSRTPAWNVFAA